MVIGTLDPNPVMAGKSVEILQNNQIQVEVGVLEEDCRKLIKVFRKFITTKNPFVLMKYAMTMDGKIATYTKRSKWITGKEARQRVHQTRHAFSAIMVGVNTVIYDNPSLTCRLENGRSPAGSFVTHTCGLPWNQMLSRQPVPSQPFWLPAAKMKGNGDNTWKKTAH